MFVCVRMPKIRTKKTKYPADWEKIAETLDSISAKMREAETADQTGKRKDELMWPIFRLHHQRSRYIYEMYYVKHEISKDCYEFCLKEGWADALLIAKWKKVPYFFHAPHGHNLSLSFLSRPCHAMPCGHCRHRSCTFPVCSMCCVLSVYV